MCVCGVKYERMSLFMVTTTVEVYTLRKSVNKESKGERTRLWVTILLSCVITVSSSEEERVPRVLRSLESGTYFTQIKETSVVGK